MVDLITFQFNNFYVVSQIYNKAINFFFLTTEHTCICLRYRNVVFNVNLNKYFSYLINVYITRNCFKNDSKYFDVSNVILLC